MRMKFISVLCIFLVFSEERVVEYAETFDNITEANISQSFDIIQRLKLKSFQYKYDTVAGRNHLSVIGPEIQALIPDGLRRYPRQSIMDPTSPGKSITLKNYYVIDKDTVFMHNVAATQVLIDLSRVHSDMLKTLEGSLDLQLQKIEHLQEYLTQEASIQLIEKRKIVQTEMKAIEMQVLKEKVHGEEERKTLDYRKSVEEDIESTREQFAQRRLEAEDQSRKDQNKELVDLQEASQIRIELKRRETEAELQEKQIEANRLNALLESNTTLERARIDVEGRIRQQRENQDIEMLQLEQKNKAEMEKVIRAIQVTFDNIGTGFTNLVTDKDKLLWFISSCVLLAAGIYIAREVVRITGRYVEQHLGKPSLVRETSRTTGLVGFFKSLFSTKYGEEELSDVVLNPDLKVRIIEVARSTKNSQKHAAPYRHLLLYGPPGTGKTMVAKRLARCSGLDYAIMSGGDVGPLGSDAVTELHAIFRWAKSSPRGVLLFIDEAEAFLGCRARRDMSEAMRNALNALLYQTGEQSQKFMMVIATNRPEDLDNAVTDRIDETLHFKLPGEKERLGMLKMYYKRYILEAHLPHNEFGRRKTQKWRTAVVSPFVKKMEAIDANQITDKHLSQACARTAGMSGREISKLLMYLQSVVYGQDERVVTVKLLNRVVDDKVKEHERKVQLKSE